MISRENTQMHSILLNITGVQFQKYFVCLFYTSFYVTQTGLKLIMQPKMTLAFWSSHLYLLTAEVTGTSQ